MTPGKTSQKSAIKLEMSGPKITADIFSRSVRTFFDLIEEVAANVSAKRRAIDWLVSIESGSITICARPESVNGSPALVAKTTRAVAKGIKAIAQRSRRPAYFSDTALQKLHELGSIVGLGDKGVEHVRIRIGHKCNELSPASVAYIDELLGTATSSYGTIEGNLLAVNVKGRLKFSVYETFTGKPVTCFFGDELFKDVIAAIRKRVSAYGMIRYRKNGEPASIDIEQLNVFPCEDELPSFADVIGILRD
jgi:hypothetical protein